MKLEYIEEVLERFGPDVSWEFSTDEERETIIVLAGQLQKIKEQMELLGLTEEEIFELMERGFNAN